MFVKSINRNKLIIQNVFLMFFTPFTHALGFGVNSSPLIKGTDEFSLAFSQQLIAGHRFQRMMNKRAEV